MHFRSIRALTLVFVAAMLTPLAAHAQGPTPDPATMKVAATSGAQLFTMTCAACHQADGAGLPSRYPPLASSEFVLGDPRRLVHIVLRGLTGAIEVEGETFTGEMPGWAPALNDAQVAAVLTYVRSSFGNTAPPITAAFVAQVRLASAARKTPYTAADLAKLAGPPAK